MITPDIVCNLIQMFDFIERFIKEKLEQMNNACYSLEAEDSNRLETIHNRPSNHSC